MYARNGPRPAPIPDNYGGSAFSPRKSRSGPEDEERIRDPIPDPIPDSTPDPVPDPIPDNAVPASSFAKPERQEGRPEASRPEKGLPGRRIGGFHSDDLLLIGLVFLLMREEGEESDDSLLLILGLLLLLGNQ